MRKLKILPIFIEKLLPRIKEVNSSSFGRAVNGNKFFK